jgi:hypothetical protein
VILDVRGVPTGWFPRAGLVAMETCMINDREHRILEDLERRMAAEDPGFAERLRGLDPWARWRRAWRFGVSVPVVLLATVLAVVGFSLHVSSLGLLFLGWALVGAMRWLVRADDCGGKPHLRPPYRG